MRTVTCLVAAPGDRFAGTVVEMSRSTSHAIAARTTSLTVGVVAFATTTRTQPRGSGKRTQGAHGMADFTPLTGAVKRKPFVVLDIESKDGETQKAGFTRPFMVGLYNGKRFAPFFDSTTGGDWQARYWSDGGCVDRAMRALLTKRYQGYHIYAHNAGRFDYLFLLPWLMGPGEKLGYRFSVLPVASSILCLDVWHVANKWKKWRFLDSYKLIPSSLDKIAKTFDLDGKLKHDLDLPETDPRWLEYNRVDCEQLYDVLVKFHHYIEDVLCGEVGMTAPATAMRLYRREYLPGPLPRNEDTHEFVREGYFGGRVEPFVREGEGLYYYDLNSSYPAAMCSPMPGGLATWWYGEPPKRFTHGSRIGFCRVDVHVPDMPIPPLPVRASKEIGLSHTKLIFPVGNLTGVWEWSELQSALAVGCTIESWHTSVWYEPVDMFGPYVSDLYKYRDKASPDYDAGLESVVKIMLNSTYGKFGMKTLRRKILRWDDPELPEDAMPASPDPDSPIWYVDEECDAAYVMPQIAARVTALGRVRLYEVMQQALRLGGQVYYCDTDSVITDVELPTGTGLGELKDEFPVHGGRLHGEFIAPKVYLLTADGFEHTKAKGVRNRSLERVRALRDGLTIYEKRLEKVGSLARKGFARGPRMVNTPRTMLLGAGKRESTEGVLTLPYHVDMW